MAAGGLPSTVRACPPLPSCWCYRARPSGGGVAPDPLRGRLRCEEGHAVAQVGVGGRRHGAAASPDGWPPIRPADPGCHADRLAGCLEMCAAPGPRPAPRHSGGHGSLREHDFPSGTCGRRGRPRSGGRPASPHDLRTPRVGAQHAELIRREQFAAGGDARAGWGRRGRPRSRPARSTRPGAASSRSTRRSARPGRWTAPIPVPRGSRHRHRRRSCSADRRPPAPHRRHRAVPAVCGCPPRRVPAARRVTARVTTPGRTHGAPRQARIGVRLVGVGRRGKEHSSTGDGTAEAGTASLRSAAQLVDVPGGRSEALGGPGAHG